MKRLSTLWSIRLLFWSKILSIIAVVVFAILNSSYFLDLLQHNIPINILKIMISVLIYYNLSGINSNFFKMSIFAILSALISFSSFILNEVCVLQGDLGLVISNVLDFVALFMGIPMVYYLYTGFCKLVIEYNADSLYLGWRKIGIASIVNCIMAIITHSFLLFGSLNSVTLVSLIFIILGILGSILLIIVEIFELVYTYKTLLVIKRHG